MAKAPEKGPVFLKVDWTNGRMRMAKMLDVSISLLVDYVFLMRLTTLDMQPNVLYSCSCFVFLMY